MAQIKPFLIPATEIAQREKERLSEKTSRGGEASANPPSTNLPPSVKLQSSQPPASVPDTGKVPAMDPVGTPLAALANRVVNNVAPNLSVNLTERDINEAIGNKPQAPNVIARDAHQAITSDQPDDADHT